jgi:hypothetical protein
MSQSLSIPRRRDAGLPEGRIRRMLYNPRANAVIIALLASSSGLPVTRLYCRRHSWRKYRQIGRPESDETFDSPVTSQAPYLFFLASKVFATPNGIGGQEPRLGIAELANARVTYVDARSADGSPFVLAELLGASPEGRSLYCSAGFPTGRPEGIGMLYHVCRFDLGSRKLSRLTRLRGVWF